MNQEGIETLLLVGNNHASGGPLFSTGSFRYLADFFIFSLYGLLLFFREDEPVMLVPMELQEAMARKYSWIKDIRISFNYAETVAQVLQEKGLHDRKVGVISMESLPGRHLSFPSEKAADGRLLRSHLPDPSPSLHQKRGRKASDGKSGRIERWGLSGGVEAAKAWDERV
jgi:hypothetical protein